MKRAEKYLVWTDVLEVDFASVVALENLRLILLDGVANDKAKYCLPESYKTELTWTINARSLQNFIALRSSKSALWEIRDLANMILKLCQITINIYLKTASLKTNHKNSLLHNI